jgi:DNA repair protein SbcC/Rad50
MHITRIELENVKSHKSSRFEFERGTTAITGENGAGKTTIVEAVAWTLFDVLDYRKDDFVRRGAKKGSVRVSFISSQDDREYTVHRDTGTGYHVFDPRLKVRIADKKEEVVRFLWRHLGVEPGTDLDSLFRRAIGVPQGTYTAIFLETPAERKKAFDRLLKVEEYRRGADELLRTSRFLDSEIAAVRERIARASGELDRFDAIETDERAAAQREKEFSARLEELEAEITAGRRRVDELDAAAAEVEKKRLAADRSHFEAEQARLRFAHAEREKNAAEAASRRLAEVEADHRVHLDAVARLSELERERRERDGLRAELTKIEAALANVLAKQQRCRESLEEAAKAHTLIEELKPKAAEQERLEAELTGLREQVAAVNAAGTQASALESKLERLRESFRAIREQLSDAEEKSRFAVNLAELEKQDSEVAARLATLRAALERDVKFQQEIRNGLCPILSQRCLNLQDGQSLSDFVESQFTELRQEITVFESRYREISSSLRASREAVKYTEAVKAIRERAEEIRSEGEIAKRELDELRERIEGGSDAVETLRITEAALRSMDDPRGQIRLLDAQAKREPEVRRNLSGIESNLERLRSDKAIKTEQLEIYKDLDASWENCCADRDGTLEAHRIYLASEAAAASLGELSKLLEEAQAALRNALEDARVSNLAFDDAAAGYDAEAHRQATRELAALQADAAEAGALLRAARQRKIELEAEIVRLAAVRESMQAETAEKASLEKIAETADFIRNTLKEAAPRVARNYIYHVSIEANQMFREITGIAERTLKWTEDYGIILEEGGYDRPFVSLSGGEQMAAALAVRLAILKQMSDIRIAFFDEPTTNMDLERRERLAEQISQIRHFEQMFVISHDDTFESYVDNVVTVEKGHNDELALQKSI